MTLMLNQNWPKEGKEEEKGMRVCDWGRRREGLVKDSEAGFNR